MIIQASDIASQGTSSYSKKETQSVSLTAFGSGKNFSYVSKTETAAVLTLTGTTLEKMQQAHENNERIQAEAAKFKPNRTQTNPVGNRFAPINPLELKASIIEMMIAALTGKKVEASSILGPQNRQNPLTNAITGQAAAFGASQSQAFRGVSGGYDLVTTTASMESESVSYSAKGLVQTADGKNISVNISMNMSRSTVSVMQNAMSFAPSQGNNFCDPLIINYAGTAASLSGETFDFDLTMDGKKENIHFAGQGSGFLALDKNGDGKIGDGSELFGPQSGNGFNDLRQYDKDGNGWIDEADSVFSQLRVWAKDQNGKDQLFTLKELDIGAIYLGEVKTSYGLNSPSGTFAGQMQSTSFFLKENGGAGTVSHVDLVV